LDISQIYENLFILFYLITICIITIILGDRMKKILYNMDNKWFLFYTISVLFISIPISLIVTTIVVTFLMYII